MDIGPNLSSREQQISADFEAFAKANEDTVVYDSKPNVLFIGSKGVAGARRRTYYVFPGNKKYGLDYTDSKFQRTENLRDNPERSSNTITIFNEDNLEIMTLNIIPSYVYFKSKDTDSIECTWRENQLDQVNLHFRKLKKDTSNVHDEPLSTGKHFSDLENILTLENIGSIVATPGKEYSLREQSNTGIKLLKSYDYLVVYDDVSDTLTAKRYFEGVLQDTVEVPVSIDGERLRDSLIPKTLRDDIYSADTKQDKKWRNINLIRSEIGVKTRSTDERNKRNKDEFQSQV